MTRYSKGIASITWKTNHTTFISFEIFIRKTLKHKFESVHDQDRSNQIRSPGGMNLIDHADDCDLLTTAMITIYFYWYLLRGRSKSFAKSKHKAAVAVVWHGAHQRAS